MFDISVEELREKANDPFFLRDVDAAAEYLLAAARRIETMERERRESMENLSEMENRYSRLRHRARILAANTEALAELLCPLGDADE